MKKFLLLLLVAIPAFGLKAQIDSAQAARLNERFVETYGQTNKALTLFERLSDATRLFFSQDNQLLEESISQLASVKKISGDSATNIVFDSLMSFYLHNHIWDDFKGRKEKYLAYYSFYNEKVCPCISEKIKRMSPYRLDPDNLAQCVRSLVTDTSYINGANKLMGSVSINDLYEISNMALPYLYEHCPALYHYSMNVLRNVNVYDFLATRTRRLYEVDEAVAALYKADARELSKVFPAHKKYSADLKALRAVLDQPGAASIHEKNENAGNITIVKTYYRYAGDKLILLGQSVYSLEKDSPASVVRSLQFTAAEKMKYREKYFALITGDDVQPPPEQ